MPRKTRIDTAAGIVETLNKAARVELSPPDHVPLEKAAMPFWDSIMESRGRSEWSNHDLEYAALLARDLQMLEHEQRLLADEGTVVFTAGGNPMKNPRESVVHGLKAAVKSQRQSLGLHDAGKGEKRDVRRRRRMAKEIEEINPLDDSDLIPSRMQ